MENLIRSKITKDERYALRKAWNTLDGVDWDDFLLSCAKNTDIKSYYLKLAKTL